ncbi:sugar phosphate isomerase/epimerase family protein [Streptomyces sp. OE57]|uniref:sugar phosphate isomerase/epimerase family protein n=1 Tax=Streptomyces lacaronensis TaxID=3379885 RepID=UPI0039B77530
MWLDFRSPTGEITAMQVVHSPKSLSLDQIPQRTKHGFGMHAVELMEQQLTAATAQERAALLEALVREDVSVAMVGLSRCVADAVDSHRAEDLEWAERLIAMSAEARAEQVRVVLMPPPIVPPVERASFEIIIATLRRLISTAKAAGVRLVIENDDPFTADPAQLVPLLDAVGSDLGLVLDTGNLEPVMSAVVEGFLAGREPGDLADATAVYEAIEALLPRAEVVHVKTYGFHPDGRSKVYDLDRVLAIIAGSGYEGPLTIEYAGFSGAAAEDAIKRTAELIRAAVPSNEVRPMTSESRVSAVDHREQA